MPRNHYYLNSGIEVPGVTTVTNQLGKGEGLMDWVWGCGKKGLDWREQRDSAGDVGTLVHELVLDFLSGEVVTLSDKDDVVKKCFEKFASWWVHECRGEPELIIEEPLVSEKLAFGGQPDIFMVSWGRLIDIKTSNGIYDNYWYQLAGYDILLRENGYKVDEYQILWLPKDDRFDAPIRKELKREKEIFKHLLKIYYLRRQQ